MIIMKRGDVLATNQAVIVHGCNCHNTMGSGIALQVKRQYVDAWLADQRTRSGDRTKLGKISYATCRNPIGRPVEIVNAYTQYDYGRGKVQVDYQAVEQALGVVCRWFPYTPIAMPLIGCGLAGGDRSRVLGIMEKVAEVHGTTFYVYEL